MDTGNTNLEASNQDGFSCDAVVNDDIEEQEPQDLDAKLKIHEKAPAVERLLMGVSFFTVVLAMAHLVTGGINAGSFFANTKAMDRGLLDRGLTTAVVANAITISKDQAFQLFDNCDQGASLTRTTLLGEQAVDICPANVVTDQGHGIHSFQFTNAESGLSLDVLCPPGDNAETECSISGSALQSAVGAECREDTDCAGEETYCFLNVCSISDGENYFVQQGAPDGGSGQWYGSPLNDLRATIKLLKPGDTLTLVGEFTNDSYDPNYTFGSIEDEHLWHFENTLYIRKINGERGRPITITSKEGAVLKGDGNNIIRIMLSSYIRFRKLEVHGEVDNIPLSTAIALQVVYRDTDGTVKYRVDPNLSDDEVMAIKGMPKLPGVTRPSYTDTRGFYSTQCHHITIESCHFHHTPGNGLRLSETEYADVLDTEVNDCSRKSYAGTMGVTPTYIPDVIEDDPVGIYRLRMLRNIVHHNYNEIWSWNPVKTFIHPVIDEGKGISCERCNTWAHGGRALFANNIVYKNGYSGLNCNDSSNLDFVGNTAYLNTYTDSVWALEQNGAKGTASRGGITFNDGTSHRMFNNIAVCDTDVNAICLGAFREAEVEASNNLQFGIGDLPLKLDDSKPFSYINVATNQFNDVDPHLKDPENLDFRLTWKSPGLEAADPTWAQIAHLDFYGKPRDIFTPDLGAIERQ